MCSGWSSGEGVIKLLVWRRHSEIARLQLLALGLVVSAGDANTGGFAGVGRGGNVLDQPAPGAGSDHLADAGVAFWEVGVGVQCGQRGVCGAGDGGEQSRADPSGQLAARKDGRRRVA